LFFFSSPPPTESYTLSLHDALPIFLPQSMRSHRPLVRLGFLQKKSWITFLSPEREHQNRLCLSLFPQLDHPPQPNLRLPSPILRSEEHTSELQSRENLVCRLLLEKK